MGASRPESRNQSAVRNEALEEAAQLAESLACGFHSPWEYSDNVAERIRALAVGDGCVTLPDGTCEAPGACMHSERPSPCDCFYCRRPR